MKKKLGSSKLKKMQTGGDSTAIYKKAADKAGSKVMTGDVRNLGKNIKDFAEKQSQLKKYQNKGKPGYDAQGNSNFGKMLGFKKGGTVKSKKK